MSKELEALKNMRADIIDYRDLIELSSYSTDEDYEIVLQAIRRNEPMKVDLAVGTWDPIWFVCPKCERLHVKDFYNYCPMCGQKLDWEDDPVEEKEEDDA